MDLKISVTSLMASAYTRTCTSPDIANTFQNASQILKDEQCNVIMRITYIANIGSEILLFLTLPQSLHSMCLPVSLGVQNAPVECPNSLAHIYCPAMCCPSEKKSRGGMMVAFWPFVFSSYHFVPKRVILKEFIATTLLGHKYQLAHRR